LEEELHKIVAPLVEKYQPEKIILFGSLATGRIHDWSDIDLLIIKETKTKRLYRRAQALRGIKRNVPIDVIILTPSEVKFLSQEGSLFIKDILEKGSVLYEREKSLV
jgi:predicted nucleotidyltransferase